MERVYCLFWGWCALFFVLWGIMCQNFVPNDKNDTSVALLQAIIAQLSKVLRMSSTRINIEPPKCLAVQIDLNTKNALATIGQRHY